MPTSRTLCQQVLTMAVVGCSLACPPPVTTTRPPAFAPSDDTALVGAPVLIGAGDIGTCPSKSDERTAMLVDSVLKADSAAGVSDAVFTAGDNAYPYGRAQDYEQCFKSSWGSPERRIMAKIRPVPGNHDYRTEGAAAYFAFFGDRAGMPGKGYYAYDLGEWRIYAINSEIVVNPAFTALDRTAQEDWLRKDLEDHKRKCVLVYTHRPRFSSSYHGGDVAMLSLYGILYDAGADVLVAGHDHTYERFAPQDPAGVKDTLRGITEIVVGTGGAELRGFLSMERNSVARVQGHYGVLKLTLGSGEYQHAFLDVTGRVWDAGRGKCH